MHSVNEKLFKPLLSDKRDFLSFENNFYRTVMISTLKEFFLHRAHFILKNPYISILRS